MLEDPSEQEIYNFYLATLMHNRPVVRFGTLMRQFCDAVGLTQLLLREHAIVECDQLKKAGFIPDEQDDETEKKYGMHYGMHQSAISRIFAGNQKPTYIQTYVWITVLKRHYNNPKIKKAFQDQGIIMPEFKPEMESALWTLSGYSSPKEVIDASRAFQKFSHIPRRLPKGTDVQTDFDIQIVYKGCKEPETQY